jgi:hypothetical protein
MDHCTDCHKPGVRPPEFTCMSCHTEIEERIIAGQGYHFRIAAGDATERNCVRCHAEHNGKDFELVRWDLFTRELDHRETGYALEGEHSGVACRECHQPENITRMSAGVSLKLDLNRTYLGLSTECSGCHEDVHRGQLSQQCRNCHTTAGWAEPIQFDHAKARFPLKGAHESVPCDQCHTTVDGNDSATQFTGLSFEDCTPCHRNPHGYDFRSTCRSCHRSENDWTAARGSRVFLHSETRFPLLGLHESVDCTSCHPGSDFTRPMSFSNCRDCHEDPHAGQFSDRIGGGSCESCHTEDGFQHSTFGYEEHLDSRFPLEGAHATVPCADCHKPAADGIVYRMRDISCVSCHNDPHGSQFAREPYRDRCETCHNVEAFKPSDFTVERHADTRFDLTGAHLETACGDCHRPAEPFVQYVFSDRSCLKCHEDPHAGQFAAYTSTILNDGTIAGCPACHSDMSWQDMAKFSHEETRYPLLGAHLDVACTDCHKSDPPEAGIAGIVYGAAPDTCIGCHEDPHKGQFEVPMSVLAETGVPFGCRRCHNEASWNEIPGFDHETTDFPLQGAHLDVTCVDCHKSDSPESGVTGIVYGAAPDMCGECHEDVHGGQFTAETGFISCDRCHRVEEWKPSVFDHDTQSDYPLEGAHRDVPCEMCHIQTKRVSEKEIILYRNTPDECSDCHGLDSEAR